MNCPRCQSLMLSEALYEHDTSDPERTISLSRCPMCGFYTDRLMEANRSNPNPMGTRDRVSPAWELSHQTTLAQQQRHRRYVDRSEGRTGYSPYDPDEWL